MIVFDELFNYSGFESGECKALFEVVHEFGMTYEWIGVSHPCPSRVQSAALVVTGFYDA